MTEKRGSRGKRKRPELSPRSRRVLQVIVEGYIETAEPVGSRTVSRKSMLNLSPATIRNIMADLEELGYIRQPHTSAGRVPTDEGYRFYVDTLLKCRKLQKREREKIWKSFQSSDFEVDTIMTRTSQLLSELSHYTAMVLSPRINNSILKHIEYIRLSPKTLLAILVTENGIFQTRLVQTECVVSQRELDRFNNYLNSILTGLTLTEVRQRLIAEKQRDEHLKHELTQALELGEKVIEQVGRIQKDELYIEGKTHIFDQPEFSRPEKIKRILQTLEEKELFIQILNKTLTTTPEEAADKRILIGSENDHRIFGDCSLILASYSKGGTPLGSIGILGPTRMDYGRVIPLVDYTAQVLGRLFEAWMEEEERAADPSPDSPDDPRFQENSAPADLA
ncbi:MAG: heat-inducible transcription repressor HrcA [Deltaproteobacteria bacterium]|nr:MAG: heat-inducible transcription repressor HrcA [Deltaproteobacteria bacterium]